MRVALDAQEMLALGTLGLARCIDSLEKNRKGAHGFNRDYERWQIDVEGLLCEGAAAKGLGIPYVASPTGELDTLTGDIGPGLQVRGTKYNSGNLLIHDKDVDDHKFILVTGIYGVYDIRGWIYAKEGKKKAYWKEYKGRSSYWVSQDKLRPIDTVLA